jgi:hypothetical protein
MGSFARRMVHNVPEVAQETAPAGRAQRNRIALALGSLLVHAALVWLLPPADLRPKHDATIYAPVELVEWTPAEAPPGVPARPEPTPAEVVPSEAPPEPTPPDEAPRARPRAPTEPPSAEMDTAPAPPSEPATPQPDGGQPGAPAIPITNPRGAGGMRITSPRLDGSAARKIGGDKHGAALPPATSGRVDAEPQTLAEAGFLRGKKGELEYQDPLGHFKATLLPDGRVKFRDFAVARGTIRSGGKVAGMSEIIRSAQGKDLFWLDKKKLLERTEKLRLAMAVKWAEAQVNSRLKGLYGDLLDIWSDAERTAVQRREQLFERWDECVEAMTVDVKGFGDTAKSSIDELREKAGGEARASIEAFIRRHLPKGSENAYTPEELRDLNRRRHSEEKFDPYAREG